MGTVTFDTKCGHFFLFSEQIYVRYFEIIEDDDTVATADVNALTGELAREISPYHH